MGQGGVNKFASGFFGSGAEMIGGMNENRDEGYENIRKQKQQDLKNLMAMIQLKHQVAPEPEQPPEKLTMEDIKTQAWQKGSETGNWDDYERLEPPKEAKAPKGITGATNPIYFPDGKGGWIKGIEGHPKADKAKANKPDPLLKQAIEMSRKTNYKGELEPFDIARDSSAVRMNLEWLNSLTGTPPADSSEAVGASPGGAKATPAQSTEEVDFSQYPSAEAFAEALQDPSIPWNPEIRKQAEEYYGKVFEVSEDEKPPVDTSGQAVMDIAQSEEKYAEYYAPLDEGWAVGDEYAMDPNRPENRKGNMTKDPYKFLRDLKNDQLPFPWTAENKADAEAFFGVTFNEPAE